MSQQHTTQHIEEGTSLWQDAWLRLRKNKAAVAGAITLAIMVLGVIIVPEITGYSYEEQDLFRSLEGPSSDYLFGTDSLGRDLLTRVMYGGRISFLVGIVATAVSLIIGVTWGTVAGYFGGKLDSTMMRIVDIMYGMPVIILVILLTVIFERNIILLFFALGAVEWLTMARIVRGQVASLRKQDFVEALESMGVRKRTILFKHIVPNTLGPIIVYTTLLIPNVILAEAFLSFLGLGVQPPETSWGLLISEGVRDMRAYPWPLLFPGVFLALTLFSLNFLGDGLRDALDPKSSKD